MSSNDKNSKIIKWIQLFPTIINIGMAILVIFVLLDNSNEWDLINSTAQQIINLPFNFTLFIIFLCGFIGLYSIIYLILVLKSPENSQIPIICVFPIVFSLILESFLLLFLIQIEWISVYEIYIFLGSEIGGVLYFILNTVLLGLIIFLIKEVPILWRHFNIARSNEELKKTNGIFKKGLRPLLILKLTIIWYIIAIPFLSIIAFQHPRLFFWEYYLSQFKWNSAPVYIHIASFIISIMVFLKILAIMQKRNDNNRKDTDFEKKNLVVVFIMCLIIQIISLIMIGIQQSTMFAIFNPLFFLTLSYGLLGVGYYFQIIYYRVKEKKKEDKSGKKEEKISGLFLILMVLIPIAWIGLYQPMFSLIPLSIDYQSDVPIIKNSYSNLTYVQKTLFDEYLENELPPNTNVSDYLSEGRSTRTAVRVASGLLFRNDAGDVENAVEILNWLALQQIMDKSNRRDYGSWKNNPADDNIDRNWREFVGCELILILERHSDKLPESVVESIKKSLLAAAQGGKERNLSPTYTNIAIMNAFLMNYVGNMADIPSLEEIGLFKARHIYVLFYRDQAFTEFNSPTYDGVAMLGLTFWRDLSPCEEIRNMGRELELKFWENIALFYHPGFKNMVGPFFRSYSMDMTKYNTILGMWITMVLNDFDIGPLPRKSGAAYFEISNIFPAVQVGYSIPEDVKQKLISFDNPRSFSKNIPESPDLFSKGFKVSVVVNENWMMGGVQGLNKIDRDTSQIKVGTIYWNSSTDQSISWLMVPSAGAQYVEVIDNRMRIWRDDGMSQIIFHISGKDLDLSFFETDEWDLPGLTISSSLDPSLTTTTIQDIMEFKSTYRVGENIENIIQIQSNVSELILEIN